MASTSTYKPFNQYLHDVYDGPARKAVSNWVKMKWGLDARDNPNKFGVDLICFRSDSPVGALEVEVRQEGFDRHGSIHVGHRKAKLFQEGLPTLFFALAQDLSYAYWVKADSIEGCPLIEVKNFYVPNGELFYDCPISIFKRADLTDLF
jgi:hypothetical protein